MGDKQESAGVGESEVDEEVSAQEASEAEHEQGGGEDEQPAASDPSGELEKLREALLRTRADMDNMQKRAEREMDRARMYHTESLVRDLLPVIDGLEQGLENSAEGDASREGLALTYRLLLKALESHGLEVLDPEGERFDPQWHEAISMQPSEEREPDTVLTVVQKGFRLHDRLLRAARVIVARAP
ncbi:MAG: nucleotide exchange factor GrpE [Gammaproteobacteria bacterium]|jgi:molecular chaperone GrpE|nr:nucleotide exchange factor GrpE [Gammaproteobacteria bacterium]NBD95422.1 nucleotide exchange factor GrpE [Gammaproteobacteria bacterium]